MNTFGANPTDEGKAAKAAGEPMSVNPYRAGSQESADWLHGYTADERKKMDPDRKLG